MINEIKTLKHHKN